MTAGFSGATLSLKVWAIYPPVAFCLNIRIAVMRFTGQMIQNFNVKHSFRAETSANNFAHLVQKCYGECQ